MTMLRRLAFCAAAALASVPAAAQEGTGRVTVEVRAGAEPVAEAVVRSGAVTRTTGEDGRAVLALPAGARDVTASKPGHSPATVTLTVRAGADTVVVLALEEHAEELEEIVVTSTRSGQRLEDEPTRVEVLAREEVEEKMLMTPGDIAMMLNETSGLRVQTTSPSLGGASVRVQGLRGRYTQVLSDGLPLYGGQSGALSLLQIPPMDLGQVEVIKGAASALYGASALGGVVNLVSRRPADDRELLLNQTTLGGSDAVGWASGALSERWGYTLLASAHRQGRNDRDDDGWADLPGYRRGVLRPRLFWEGGEGRSLFLTMGAMGEDREGGTIGGATTAEGTGFREELTTRRLDAGAVARLLLPGGRLVALRGSGTAQRHGHRFGEVRERDLHRTAFAEAALSGTDAGHTWVVGGAFQHEGYDARDVAGFDYTYAIPSLFAQDEYAVADWLTLAASGRVDRHSDYGTFFSPRFSVLLRPAEWTVRLSAGTGYHAPTPFTEETEAVGLSRLLPLSGLEAERARSVSADVGRTIGPFELNATVFGSRVENALQLRDAGAGRFALANADGDVRTVGTELLARYHREGIHFTATHTWIHATEPHPDEGGRREVPLTPRHAVGLVGMWEAEGRGRVGLEFYYTGRQALEDNPFRDRSEPYVSIGALAEWRVGRARLFVNLENLTDTRQTRYDPLLLPARTPEGRWTTDVWAPLEGRVVNAGVRLEL